MATDNLIHYNLIGGSSNDSKRRFVGTQMIDDHGWHGFIDRRIKPIYDAGVRRFWIHWPFGLGDESGTVHEDTTNWSQWLMAKKTTPWLTETFADAWKSFFDQTVQQNSPLTEVVFYLGRPWHDPGFSGLVKKPWMTRALDSIGFASCLPKSVVSFGIDAAVGVPVNQPDIELAKALVKMGHRVYVESRPIVAFPDWSAFNVICEAKFWKRSDPAVHPDAAWAMPNDKCRNVVRGIIATLEEGQDWNNLDWLVEEAKTIRADGHTVLTDLMAVKYAGLLDELIAAC